MYTDHNRAAESGFDHHLPGKRDRQLSNRLRSGNSQSRHAYVKFPDGYHTRKRDDNLAYSNTAEFNDPYPIGTTTITWTATDTDTQSASCMQTVTVTGTDTTPPTLNVPPNVSATTSSCTATLDDELGVATAEDDCGTVNITRTGIPTFACPTPQNPNRQCESFVFPTGTTIITYTATNSSGLSTTGTQTVTVTEDPAVNPTIYRSRSRHLIYRCRVRRHAVSR